jgi:hypothetical protein
MEQYEPSPQGGSSRMLKKSTRFTEVKVEVQIQQ